MKLEIMKIKSIYILVFTLIANIGLTQEIILDEILAKVGGEIILLSDVEEQYAYFKSGKPDMEESAKCEILESVIAQKLIVNQAKVDSLEVTTAEVEQQLELRLSSILGQMNGDEELFEQTYGATVAEMKERYRNDQKEQILSEKMQRQLINEVVITPTEVIEFYNSIPTDSLPFLSAEVEISEIVMQPKVNSVELEKAKAKLENIRKQIMDGSVSFQEMARKHSMDGSAANGGDLGFSNRGNMVQEFEAVAYNLKPDEISEIVETEFGLHLIQLIERRGNKMHARHILIRPEITQSDLDKTEATLDSIRQLIEIDSISFEYAHEKYSMEAAQSYHYGGRIRNPNNGNTFFQTGDLPSDIYFAIEDLEVGQLTSPVAYRDVRGDQLFRVIRLDSSSKPHQVNLDQDYNKIQQYAKEGKKNEYLAEWIEDKYNSTFITVSSNYKHCPNVTRWIQQ